MRKQSIASWARPSNVRSATESTLIFQSRRPFTSHVTTVYRYFSDSRTLFQAVAAKVADKLVAQLAETLRGIDEPTDGVVQVVLYCIRHLAQDSALSFISGPGRGGCSSPPPVRH